MIAGDVLPFAVGKTEEGCDVFKGMWAYDEISRPSYAEDDCPFMEPKLKCQANGRPDKAYQNWRWQPHGCSLPRYVSHSQNLIPRYIFLGRPKRYKINFFFFIKQCKI